MPAMLWGTLALPLAGFLVLMLAGRRLGERVSALIGVGSVGLAAVVAVVAAVLTLATGNGEPQQHVLATWIRAGGLVVDFSLHYDGLALIMTLIVTVIGFLIHLFSVGYMHGDEAFHRYFAYLNLFVSSMLLLLLAGNLLVTFVGWELVGLCSFLLIGFWHKEPANSKAARKAFIVTRVGDAALALGIGLVFASLGTLDIGSIGDRAKSLWGAGGSPMATAIAVCLLIGALGKSAQLPLQVWLPDAMAGPTPVSALIHAATMVTAGVYLIARTHLVFELAPAVLSITAWIGLATLLVAGLSAMVQTDLKRTLAFSTISQIGYMFLALGVSAWGAAVFHLFTHAFFKALLFLGAGAVMHATHGEQDMLRLGGLRRQLPLVFLCFLAGAASLASVPLVTDGFYSKGWILEELWVLGPSSRILWAGALAGAFITAFYTFRMVGLVFFGTPHGKDAHRPGPSIGLPLLVLAVGTVLVGFLHTPVYLGGSRLFDLLLTNVFGHPAEAHAEEILPEIYASAVALAGMVLALLLYGRGRRTTEVRRGLLQRFLGSGFGFDTVYDRVLVRPYEGVARANRGDAVNLVVRAIELANTGLHRVFAALQSGKLRWYLLGVTLGGVLIIGVEILL